MSLPNPEDSLGWDRRLRYPPGGVRWPEPAFHDAALASEEARAVNRYGGARPNLVRYTAPTRAHGSHALITAPHAVTHWRNELRKPADLGTGFLAEALAEATGSAALIAEGEQLRDGNFDPQSPFRDELGRLLSSSPPRCVVDLHGMSDAYGPDVCLGTAYHPQLAEQLLGALVPALEGAGFQVAVNDPYDAAPIPTVTRASHARAVPAIQVELARRVRRVMDDPEPSLLLVQVMGEALDALLVDDGSSPVSVRD